MLVVGTAWFLQALFYNLYTTSVDIQYSGTTEIHDADQGDLVLFRVMPPDPDLAGSLLGSRPQVIVSYFDFSGENLPDSRKIPGS
ncbi:hypothetical protein N656DRAFT_781084 [Canariomyces notabilis]|jgi:hypothetical protein|uniref:Uncharacterized protein n=1 Tax=Canariomyces notabilis TaxID=2074819 RepID=A0AAN6TBD8_9PEZI|nr:hypothetical protein N656DRAFT_781084 [Canariomyces arenarius]